DHRHRVGDGEGELEAEVLLRLLLDLGRRPLHAERDPPERPGELAVLVDFGRYRGRGPGARSGPGAGRRGDASLDEEVAAGHATRLVRLRALQTLVLPELLREFASVDFELLRHETNSFLLAAPSRISTADAGAWKPSSATSRCRRRSRSGARPAVGWELYTTLPGLSQRQTSGPAAVSGRLAGRRRESDRVPELLRL